jgi:predicted ATPase
VRSLPAGTVTFLFTDIEGSTRLLHELGPEGFAAALDEHRHVLRDAFERNGGVEVDTQGDAFFVAFPTAPGALAAAREAQAALVIPVRMGIHTGSPLLTADGYIGTDVHRAARIAAAGHGGQVLVSAATAALVGGELRDLGQHRLKDLTEAERLFQLGEGVFPPLRTLYRTNLPVPPTPFVGRAEELVRVRSLLERDDVRLLTLTGPGGSGKTRLGLQAAAMSAESYPDGVWWVPLAPLADAGDVASTAARALGGGPTLSEAVGERRLLLLLDNFEHVLAAATDVADLIAACPHADLLVTSRERLHVRSEQVYPVPVLGGADARALFVARARAGQPDFEADALVDEICTRLDDLPLAVELAAARTRLLATGELLDRLGSSLDLLRGERDTEERHRTLRATIKWSYELMEIAEQRLFAALSVFRGGWELGAAESVCGADIDLLEALVDKSLVQRSGSGRFFMLETLREFASELLPPDDRETLMRRLLEDLAARFETANLGAGATGPPRMELAQVERANIDSALAWAADTDRADAGLTLLTELELYWATNDPLGGRRHIDRLLGAAGEDLEPATLAGALRVRGGTHAMSGQGDLAEQDFERAAEIFRSVGDEAEAVHMMHRLATGALRDGDVARAARLASDALDIDRRHGRRREEAEALNVLSQVAFIGGDLDEGVRLGYESAAVAESVGFTWWHGVTLVQLAEFLVTAGDLDAAARPFADGLRSLAAVDDRINLPIVVAAIAALAAQRGDAAQSGVLWGAVEVVAETEPRVTTDGALSEYAPRLEPVRGDAFEKARAWGRSLSLEDAVPRALASLEHD